MTLGRTDEAPAAAARPARLRMRVPGWLTRPLTRDSLFVALVLAVSAAPYLARLGFSSDDWAFLGSLTTHGDLSVPGRSAEHDFAAYLRPRPVQVAYQTFLYAAFGTDPLGYHVVNTLVLSAMGALVYQVLRELGLGRLPAVAVAVTYGLLPHYSTDRFWWAAFGYGLAMTFAFASLYFDLRALRTDGAARWWWKLAALAALALSGLGFEVALPLLAAAVPVLWYRSKRPPGGPLNHTLGRAGAILFLGSNAAVLAGIAAVKLAFPVGVGVGGSYPLHFARLALGSAATGFGSYGLGLPEAVRWAVETVDGTTLALGVALAGAIGAYVAALSRRDAARTWPLRHWLRLVAAGVAVFALGYGIFLTNGRILFSSTGISNRVSIAAAVGVAMIWVGLAGAVSAAVRPRWRAWILAPAVAVLCLSGYLVVQGLAAAWAEAWQREQATLAAIQARLPALEPDTVIVLDGVCPYAGPAVVFESNWDLAGALETRYGDPTVRADVASANLTLGDDGLSTRLYGDQTAHYGYDPRLLVFDARDWSVRSLPDAGSALAWWATRQELRCPRGAAGYGALTFSWDARYRRLENASLWK